MARDDKQKGGDGIAEARAVADGGRTWVPRDKSGDTRSDKRVIAEARGLVKETRRAVRKHEKRLDADVVKELSDQATALDRAMAESDSDGIRRHLYRLDVLHDKHLPFVRKSTLREYAESIGVAVLIALFLRAFVVEAFKIPSGSMIPTLQIGDHIFVNKFKYGVRIPFTDTKLFNLSPPERGEVVVFINPCDGKDFIKRIVAVQGDTVEVRCDRLWVNGEPVAREKQGTYRAWDVDDSGLWTWNDAVSYAEQVGELSYDIIEDPHQSPRSFPTHANDVPACLGEVAELGTVERSVPEKHEDRSRCGPKWRYVVPDEHVFVMGDNRDNSNDSRSWGPVPIDNIKGEALFIWWATRPGGKGKVDTDRLGSVVE